MIVVFCGGRHYQNRENVFRVLDRVHAETPIQLLVHGAATGADSFADEWARSKERSESSDSLKRPDEERSDSGSLQGPRARGIPVRPVSADWKDKRFGNPGRRRNHVMLEMQPDLIVGVPGGSGTLHMKSIGRDAGVRVRSFADDGTEVEDGD